MNLKTRHRDRETQLNKAYPDCFNFAKACFGLKKKKNQKSYDVDFDINITI